MQLVDEAVLVEEGGPGSGGAYIVTGWPVIHNKSDYRYNKCDHRFRAERRAQPPKSPRPAEQLWDYGGSYFVVIIFLLFSPG